jgi:hypothetical protein
MIRAPYDPKYFRRFLWITLACVAYSAWCCYDAWVAYPAKGKIAVAYESAKAEFDKVNPPATKKDEFALGPTPQEAKWARTWRELAKKNGLPETPPEKTAKEIREDIGKQYFMMVLCGLVGLPSLLKWFRGRGTWVEGNEELIRNSRGQEFRIADITKIDKTKWEDKGIAKIYYQGENKRKGKFVMDDFKYQREPMSKIMAYAQANLSPEQIIGDEEKATQTDATSTETTDETESQ